MANTLNVIFNPRIVKQGAREIARVLITGADSWVTTDKKPLLKLYSNDPAITDETVIGDLVECVFTGYDPGDELLLVATDTENGNPILQDPFESQTADNPLTVPDTVRGIYITDADATVLIGVMRLDNAFAVNQPGDKIQIITQIPFPGWLPPSPP